MAMNKTLRNILRISAALFIGGLVYSYIKHNDMKKATGAIDANNESSIYENKMTPDDAAFVSEMTSSIINDMPTMKSTPSSVAEGQAKEEGTSFVNIAMENEENKKVNECYRRRRLAKSGEKWRKVWKMDTVVA